MLQNLFNAYNKKVTLIVGYSSTALAQNITYGLKELKILLQFKKNKKLALTPLFLT